MIIKLSKYRPEFLTNNVIKFLKKGAEYSHDDIVSILDYFFELIQCTMQREINENKEKISDFKLNKIIKEVISISEYDPYDNPFIFNNTGNFLMLSEWHENKRYYNNRRKVSSEYFNIGKAIIYKNKKPIEEKLHISIEEYYEVLESITKNAFNIKTDINYINYENIKKTNSTEKIIKLLQRENSESNVRIYNINNYLFSTDFFYFEENSYSIIEELLIENNFKSLYQKICRDKGDYLEIVIYDKLNLIVPSYLNATIDNLETDVLSIFKNNIIVHIEAKAIKYDSFMKEQKEKRNNCKNYLKKGLKQLYLRDKIIYDGNFNIISKDKLIMKSEVSIYSVPILITMDDIFDFSQLTLHESLEKGFPAFTPLILNLDDFFFYN